MRPEHPWRRRHTGNPCNADSVHLSSSLEIGGNTHLTTRVVTVLSSNRGSLPQNEALSKLPAGEVAA